MRRATKSSPQQNRGVSYKRQLIAYLDILGFSAVIQRTRRDAKSCQQLVAALHRLLQDQPAWRDQRRYRELRKAFQRPEHPANLWSRVRPKMHDSWGIVFSDNIVLAEPYTPMSLMFLMWKLGRLSFDLVAKGFFTRGAITVGALYHNDYIVFGPGLIEAYQMQHDAAVYPRVILSEALAASILSDTPGHRPLAGVWDLCRKSIRKDSDGIHYVDYLGARVPFIRPAKPDKLRESLVGIRQSLATAGAATRRDPRARAKVQWFISYLDRSLTEEGNLPLGLATNS